MGGLALMEEGGLAPMEEGGLVLMEGSGKSELVVVWHWWRILYRVDWCWCRIHHLEGSAESVLAQVKGSV